MLENCLLLIRRVSSKVRIGGGPKGGARLLLLACLPDDDDDLPCDKKIGCCLLSAWRADGG